uniref:Uncharacterized protein n=1 Tax=Arundo donax TaxID=35708 RepID=A0A0A9DJJ1_ARUDO
MLRCALNEEEIWLENGAGNVDFFFLFYTVYWLNLDVIHQVSNENR